MRSGVARGDRLARRFATLAVTAVIAGSMLTGCGRTEAPVRARVPGRPPAQEPVAEETSTVRAPALPTFENSTWFVVGADGTGKAVARFDASAPGPERRRWHRVVRLIVDGTKVDGVWVDNVTFEGRLTLDTVVTAKYETAAGSGKYRKVSRRLEDILAADPSWRGFDDDTRVSVTFKKVGNGPVSIQTMTALDPVPKWVTLPDPGPQYRYGKATDPIVINAMSKLDGESASIVGYVIDYVTPESRGRSILEMVVGKDGKGYRLTGWGRPRAAFGHEAPRRAQPEPAGEASQRRRAEAVGSRLTATIIPKGRPAVFAYIVRVHRIDGTVMDVVVEADARPEWGEPRQVRVQPWRAPSEPLPQALPLR